MTMPIKLEWMKIESLLNLSFFTYEFFVICYIEVKLYCSLKWKLTIFFPEVLRFLFVIIFSVLIETHIVFKKGKGLPQQDEVAQGVPGRLRPRIFLTFGTTRVVGRQP